MADDVKIVMFCCNWCSYGGADTAGTARMQYPGCHMGDCHYDAGNYKLDRRMRLIYKLVEDMGIGKERVHHDWISASEGEKFSTAVNMMVNRIKDLGPAPLKDQLNAEG
ncbi:hydrogenase iron-sulfur subunit [uncultured Methanobrevibacter sp.]|uniref:hydrogenase iron-sulfur subunit n=1 Tax=uncultured Methanobrevibacter sp. TaxID=253161 RepID=UPI0025D9216D|nr:hydrogenase iron-sulfur subunit [uncultured Methanobrevibacter sp.]